MRVIVVELATGAVIARKRGTKESCEAWAARYDPSVYAVSEAWLPLTKVVSPARALLTIKAQRNTLLNRWAWTVSPASPLTKANQQEWMSYLKALHRITKGLTDPSLAVWPTMPELVYDDAA